MRSLSFRRSTSNFGDTAPPKGELSPALRRAFDASMRSARQVLRRRFRVLHLLKRAYVKLGANSDAMSRVQDDFLTMMRMVRAWALRDYRSVPWKSLVYVVAAIVYFVNPIDLIPDVLVGIGFIDDAAVAAAVVRAVHDQLRMFREWEAGSQRELSAPEAETEERKQVAA